MTVKVRPFLRKGLERWEVDIRFNWPEGPIYRERKVAPGTSRSAAQKWGETRERELLAMGKEGVEKEKRREEELPPPEVPTLEAFWPRYLSDHCKGSGHSPSTIETSTNTFNIYLKPHLGQLKLDEISDARVDAFKARVIPAPREKGPKVLAPKTVNNALSLLRHMLKTARRWKLIDAVPCEIVKRKVPKHEAEFLSFEAFEKLVVEAKKIDPRAHLFVLLGGRAGMRRGEIIGLRWRSVDFARGVIKVVESDFAGELKSTKNGKGRDVPMTAELRAALEAHQPKEKDPLKRVLLKNIGTPEERPIERNGVRSWLMQAERAAGLDGKGKAHRLRHTLLSHLAMRGAPLRTIQEIAGHHALSMTARYLHLAPEATTEAMELLVKGGPGSAPPTPTTPTSSTSGAAATASVATKTKRKKREKPVLGDETRERGDEASETLVQAEEAPAIH